MTKKKRMASKSPSSPPRNPKTISAYKNVTSNGKTNCAIENTAAKVKSKADMKLTHINPAKIIEALKSDVKDVEADN